jgi:hypothetical protein
VNVCESLEGIKLIIAFYFDKVYFINVAFACAQELKLMIRLPKEIGLVGI